MQLSSYAPFVLRIGLGATILWFGVSQLLNPEGWTIWVPAWTAAFGFSPLVVVYLNGAFETALSILLILNFFVRPIAFVLFLHMLVLVFEIGLSPIGVRDFGLAAGFLALALWDSKQV